MGSISYVTHAGGAGDESKPIPEFAIRDKTHAWQGNHVC